jgi:pimeloyl-ACP methyl ester carboxylesterase
MGYSVGGGVALRAAIQYPDLVRKLVLVSAPFSKSGWYPDVGAQMGQVNRSGFEMMRATPMFAAYAAIAPNPDAFPDLMDRVGVMLGTDYDWTDEVKNLRLPTLLMYGDGDSISASHAVEFFELLGGGLRDAGWDGSGKSSSRLAILPDTTHYDIFESPLLAQFAVPFLDQS